MGENLTKFCQHGEEVAMIDKLKLGIDSPDTQSSSECLGCLQGRQVRQAQVGGLILSNFWPV